MPNEVKPPKSEPNQIAYPDALENAEFGLWLKRGDPSFEGRQHRDQPTVGFGLSGGGIRSATFCLGVFQSLAKLELLHKIDYISSVSGGSFFASFYGRMFARADITGFDDINKILSPDQNERLDFRSADGKLIRTWKSGVFRWLRENGRYLAPNGNGDLLIGIAVFLRNWITVQLLVAVSVLTMFLATQLARIELSIILAKYFPGFALPAVSSGADSALWWLWWSPYLYVVGAMALFGVVPLGWSYWTFSLPDPGEKGTSGVRSFRLIAKLSVAIRGLFVLLALALILIASWIVVAHFLDNGLVPAALASAAAVLELTFFWWQFAFLRARSGSSKWAPALMAIVLIATLIALAYPLIGPSYLMLPLAAVVVVFLWPSVIPNESHELINCSEKARSLLSQWLRTALFTTLAMLAFALIDSAGQSLYALSFTDRFTPRYWLIPLFGAIAGLVPFATSIGSFLSSRKPGAGISLSLTSIAGVGAAIVILPTLIFLDGLSHEIAYDFGRPADAPACVIAHYKPTRTPNPGIAAAAPCSKAGTAEPVQEREGQPVVCFLIIGLLFTAITNFSFSSSNIAWVLLNRTSLHALYCGRLIRAYLGASNESRYGNDAGVSDPVDGDDISQEDYWRPEQDTFWVKGAPLHLVNVTINETLDGRSQTEDRDRKGVGMAVGPAGFSVGIPYHAVLGPGVSRGKFNNVDIYPKDGVSRVFTSKTGPEMFRGQRLSLGNWTAISGAAVSTGLGSIGSIGTSLLTGFFNLRLGYWWNSGYRSRGVGSRASRTVGRFFAGLLPVQSSLMDEFLGRFHGTLRRYWYLTDGGHFEDLGGYELIRRRLPLIVIIDAEADANYDFAELANLIRKARLDFNAEINFINPKTPDGSDNEAFTDALNHVQEYFNPLNREFFGTLDQLRRGKWTSEPVKERKAFFKSNDPARLSLRHAALAKVTYLDSPETPCYLLLIKPTLIGEEPEDLLNYHSAHPEFPQQTTLEQFFDEAQWESYRRLGQHMAERIFRAKP